MKKLLPAVWSVLFFTVAHASPREEWFRNLSFEDAVSRSDLILAARVTGVTEIKLLRGGKSESTMFQYTFQPGSVLKGVFARDEISLGSADLGLHRAEDAKQIRKGDFLLIFLGRAGAGYVNSNRAGVLGQSMPPLSGADDPMLDAVRILLAVSAERDRVKRVALLCDGLDRAGGAGAVVLLDSLRRRPLPAAQNPKVARVVTKHLGDASPAVRESAAQTLRAILEADYLEHAPLRELAVARCVEALRLPDPNTFARADVLRALGAAGAAAQSEESMEHLIPDTEGTTIERAAQWRAVGDLKADVRGDSPSSWIDEAALDDDGELARAVEYAAARVHPRDAAGLLDVRIREKIAAGLDVRIEIASIADLPPGDAIPVLVGISRLALHRSEKAAFAETCRALIDQVPDARLVEPLSRLLAPDEPGREPAIGALLAIDSDAAAEALRPHLGEEGNLLRKLQMAEMLGRHGIRDGYAFAIEHVSEHALLEQAVAALAAIKEPDAVTRLKEILETSNDAAWNTAAVRGLGAMGAREMAPKFLALTDDLRNPLAPAALIALGDLGERGAVNRVREGLGSRNDRVVAASARASGKLLALSGVDGADDWRRKLEAIVCDADTSADARGAALDALLVVGDDRLDAALATVAREAHLEGIGLLQRVEELMRERNVTL